VINISKLLKGIGLLNEVDQTKQVEIIASPSSTTSTKTTIEVKQSANRTLSTPNDAVTGELLVTSSVQSVSNKTIVAASNTITTAASGNLIATELNAALAELQSDIDTRTLETDFQNHLSDAADAHDASAISNVPAGNVSAMDVQSAINELQSDIDSRALETSLQNHLNDASDAHDASAISVVPYAPLTATDVQSTIEQLQDQINTAVGGANTQLSNLASTTEIDVGLRYAATFPGLLTTAIDSSSQNMSIETGNATSGNSGNITLKTGTATGVRGKLNIVDASLATASTNYVWTLQNTSTGEGAWQVNPETSLTDLEDTLKSAFQPFVDNSTVMTPTNTTGTPSAGTFYTNITGRSNMQDLANDLGVRMGINRVMTQEIYPVNNERASTGASVFKVSGDLFNQIRFIGSWLNNVSADGTFPYSTESGDQVEITFYGTGLNLLTYTEAVGLDFRASVDGGAFGSNIYTPGVSGSNILGGRRYSSNSIYPVVSGLSLGVHTVTIQSFNANFFRVFGFEILNDSSNLTVQPGVSFVNGKKLTLGSQQTLSYNSGFESGTLGTRGGRVIVYQKSDGSIAKAVTPTDASQLNLASATHANEEVAKEYNFREFTAGRTDDFSIVNTLGSAVVAYTLADGVTSLLLNTGASGGLGFSTPREGVQADSGFIQFTFVGTGLDIIGINDLSIRAYDVSVDGTSIGTLNVSSVINSNVLKVVSGLPYGTHVVRFTKGILNSFGINSFIVYQPKTPTLPAGSIGLSAYNIMADYVGVSNTLGGTTLAIGRGVLRKQASNGIVYAGSWIYSGVSADFPAGNIFGSSTSGSYYEYSFFGTGLELRHTYSTVSASYTVSIDGANYTGAATAKASAGSSWTPGTSTWVVAGSLGSSLEITGLSLGIHKVRVTKDASVDFMYPVSIDVITPIHSVQTLLPYELQNLAPIGFQSLGDLRVNTALKEASAKNKNVSQAFGITADPSTSSTISIPANDMTVVHYSKTGKIRITYTMGIQFLSGAAGTIITDVKVNGQSTPVSKYTSFTSNSISGNSSDCVVCNVNTGANSVVVYWRTNTGTVSLYSTSRNLIVEDI
jgi:hypothetical protein